MKLPPDPNPDAPLNQPDAWVIAQTQRWPLPLSPDASKDEIRECRNQLQMNHLTGHDMKDFMARRANWVKIRALYEEGTPVSKLAKLFNMKPDRIVARAKRFFWKAPKNTARDIFAADGAPCSAPISLVTPEEEQELPASVRELMRERKLMNLAGAQWDAIPFKDQTEALRMRIHRLARRAVGFLETLDDEQLAQTDTAKLLKDIAAVTEKVAPVEVEQQPQRAGSMLHISVMNGDTGLPPPARVREIEAG